MASNGVSLAKQQNFPNTVVQPCNETRFTFNQIIVGKVFYLTFKTFARITALHSTLQVFILLNKIVYPSAIGEQLLTMHGFF